MKKILFVINTLGGAGAETALIELLYSLDRNSYEISLYVLTGQGELVDRLPRDVRLLNKKFSRRSVLSKEGRRDLAVSVLRSFFRNGHIFRKTGFLLKNLTSVKGKLQPDKILWRVLSEGGELFDETYDLAVAYLEGGATYYTADHVKAKKRRRLFTLIMKAAAIQKLWTGTATKKWTGFLLCQMRQKNIF